MQSQSVTLTSLCRARWRGPYVRAVFEDHELRWERQHESGTASTLNPVAHVGLANTAYLTRCVVDGTNLKAQVITAWETASQYWSWTTIKAGVIAGSDCALGYDPVDGLLHVYYWLVDGSGYDSIYTMDTADDGVNWAHETQVLTMGAAKVADGLYSLAADDGGWVFTCYTTGGSSYICYSADSGGGWGAMVSSAADFIAWVGFCEMSAYWDGSSSRHMVVCVYTDTSGMSWCSSTTYNTTTASWGGIYAVLPVGTAVPNLHLGKPSLAACSEGLYLSLVERWVDGATSSTSFTVWKNVGDSAVVWAHWGVPSCFEFHTVNRVRTPLVGYSDGTDTWLLALGQNNTYRAKLYRADSSAKAYTTANVLGFRWEVGERAGRAWVDLSNVNNALQDVGEAGSVAEAIKPYARVSLQLGYMLSGTAYYKTIASLWVESVELIHADRISYMEGPSSRVRVHCVDLWRMLEQYVVPYTLAWATRNVLFCIRGLLARAAGVTVSTDGSAAWTRTIANFSITESFRPDHVWRWRTEWIPHDEVPVSVYQVSAGTTGLENAWLLLRFAGGLLRLAYDYDVELLDGKAQAWAADYTLGSGGEIEAGHYTTAAIGGINRARVRGDSGAVARESIDAWGAMANARLIESIENRDGIATGALCNQLVQGLTYRGAAQRAGGWVRVPVVPGLELYDLLDVVDPRAGLASGDYKSRIVSLVYVFDRRSSRFHQTIGLEKF